jgi:hypothetical protein
VGIKKELEGGFLGGNLGGGLVSTKVRVNEGKMGCVVIAD